MDLLARLCECIVMTCVHGVCVIGDIDSPMSPDQKVGCHRYYPLISISSSSSSSSSPSLSSSSSLSTIVIIVNHSDCYRSGLHVPLSLAHRKGTGGSAEEEGSGGGGDDDDDDGMVV